MQKNTKEAKLWTSSKTKNKPARAELIVKADL